MKKPNLQSYTLLILLAAIWGSAFFNYKIVLKSFDVFTLSGGRLFFASIFSIAISLFFLSSVKIKDFFSKDYYLFFFIGLVNYAAPFTLIGIGIDKMSSGLAALLMSAGPFYAIILSHFLSDDKFNKYKFIGTCIGFSSVAVLVYDQIYITETTNLTSVLFVMSASLFYICGGMIIKKNMNKYNNETTTCFSLIWAALLMIPLTYYFYTEPDDKLFYIESFYSLIYLGVVSTAIAFYIRAIIIIKNGLVFMSQVSLLIPIFGVFFSYIFLQEKLYLSMLVSLILLILGLSILQKGYQVKEK